MLVRLPHTFALRLQLREGTAVDATDAGDVPLAQRIQHFAQRFGLGGSKISASDLALEQRLRDTKMLAAVVTRRDRRYRSRRRPRVRGGRDVRGRRPSFDR